MGSGLGDWFNAFLVVAGSLLVGLLIDAFLVRGLLSKAGPTHRTRRSFGLALRGQTPVWTVLLGVAVLDPFDFLRRADGVWLDRILIVLAVLSVTVFLARLAGWLIRIYVEQETVSAPGGTIFVNLARLIIWAVGLTFVLGALGVEIGPLLASLGVLGLAVSLGLQDTLSNFFSGLQMTLSRQIQPNDYIRLSTGEEGTVHDVTWRNTTVRSPVGDRVIVPNAVIGKALITNFSAFDQAHTSVIQFSVAYGSDLERIKDLAAGIAREVRDRNENAVDDFEPVCRFTALRADGVSGTVSIRVERFPDRLPVNDDLVTTLHTRLVAEGVAFGASALPASPTPAAAVAAARAE